MWYAVQSLTGDEAGASEKCRSAFPKGTCRDTFVPRYMKMKRYQGAWHQECHPLFPGYFIVDSDPAHAATIEQTLSVLDRIVRPVCVGSEFLPIKREEQEFLQTMMDPEHIIQMSEGNIHDGNFDIYQGPLRQKDKQILRVDRHKRTAEIEVPFMGEARRVKVGLEIKKKT
jgi:transcriptional antiterminator NusG